MERGLLENDGVAHPAGKMPGAASFLGGIAAGVVAGFCTVSMLTSGPHREAEEKPVSVGLGVPQDQQLLTNELAACTRLSIPAQEDRFDNCFDYRIIDGKCRCYTCRNTHNDKELRNKGPNAGFVLSPNGCLAGGYSCTACVSHDAGVKPEHGEAGDAVHNFLNKLGDKVGDKKGWLSWMKDLFGSKSGGPGTDGN